MSENTQVAKKPTLQNLLNNPIIAKRFEDIMGGDKAPAFISSIISATKTNPKLATADPNSVISSAVIAATLNLPIQSNLGFAHIVPYSTKQEDGSYKDVAQFQMGYKGYIQLAMRTGQYKTINVVEVYEGELIAENRFTGEYTFDSSKRTGDKIIGYTAFFKLINGFEKTIYWSTEKVQAHGKRYSKSFSNQYGRWQQDFDKMAMKTILKELLSKYGILSIEMQTAVSFDQTVVKDDGNTVDAEYVDHVDEAQIVEQQLLEESNDKIAELKKGKKEEKKVEDKAHTGGQQEGITHQPDPSVKTKPTPPDFTKTA